MTDTITSQNFYFPLESLCTYRRIYEATREKQATKNQIWTLPCLKVLVMYIRWQHTFYGNNVSVS